MTGTRESQRSSNSWNGVDGREKAYSALNPREQRQSIVCNQSAAPDTYTTMVPLDDFYYLCRKNKIVQPPTPLYSHSDYRHMTSNGRCSDTTHLLESSQAPTAWPNSGHCWRFGVDTLSTWTKPLLLCSTPLTIHPIFLDGRRSGCILITSPCFVKRVTDGRRYWDSVPLLPNSHMNSICRRSDDEHLL